MNAQIERELIEKYAARIAAIADTTNDRRELFEQAKEARLDLEVDRVHAGLTREEARVIWTSAAMVLPPEGGKQG